LKFTKIYLFNKFNHNFFLSVLIKKICEKNLKSPAQTLHLDLNHSWGKYEKTVGNTMFYTNGAFTSCAQAIESKIIFSCGSELKLTGVSEPSLCSYELTAQILCPCSTGKNIKLFDYRV
jgi:hypothetical protein